MKRIKIGDRWVGEGERTYIIAEAGSNHNGDFANAIKLIDTAVDAGADAVKFQIFKAENLYSKNTPGFQSLNNQDVYELIKKIETPREWISKLSDHCKSAGIEFMATPFDNEAVDLLNEHTSAFKIASFEIVDLELIKYTASKSTPMIISTGMASMEEIQDAIQAASSMGNSEIALLHCNSVYPSPPDIVNLKVIQTMKEAFDHPIGFSDHTLGNHISLAAVAMGACIIEKHITLDRTMDGPDHSFALEPDELKSMINNIRELEQAFGTGVKEVSALEYQENYMKGRRSIHANCDISAGDLLTREMLVIKRPAYGIAPTQIDELIGRKAKIDIKEDEWITWEMIIDGNALLKVL